MLQKLLLILASLPLYACDGANSQNEYKLSPSVNEQNGAMSPISPSVNAGTDGGRRDALVEERSKDYGMPLLRLDHDSNIGLEIRLWSTIGLTYFERCLRLQYRQQQWHATVMVPSIRDGELVRLKDGRAEVTKTEIAIDENVGRDLTALVDEKHLEPPLPFSQDRVGDPAILDEGIITLEAKRGSLYDVVSFRAFTSTPDGKRLIETCKRLEIALANRLGCEHR